MALKDNYILSRDFGENARLNLQLYLWKESLGYVLHPSIPIDKRELRIAEIGVGTGAWMVDMTRELNSCAQIDGLDVSHTQCPSDELLPANITLFIHDCLADPPQDLHDVYDIIHVQNFCTIIQNNDPVPVIRNLLKMLKPGGHISWGEYDFQTWKTTVVGSVHDYDNELDKLFEYTATLGGRRNANFQTSDWIADLPKTFAECGMVSILNDRRPFDKVIASFLLDTFMLGSQNVAKNVFDNLGDGEGDIVRNYVEAVGRNRREISVDLIGQIVVGQKPALK